MTTVISDNQIRQSKRTVQPTSEPVSLAELKEQLRIEPDFTLDDALLTAYISAARESIEDYCNRPFTDGGYLLEYYGFPVDNSYTGMTGMFRLPFKNILSIDDLSYIDENGAPMSIDSLDYSFNGVRGIIYTDDDWPTDDSGKGVIISLSLVEDAPDAIKQAIKMRAADYYEHREEQDLNKLNLNRAVKALADPYRVAMGV